MAEKDLVEKILEDYNEVFADIYNVLVFKGKQVINPTDLGSVSVHSMYKDDTGKLHEQERDVMKKWKNHDLNIAICGIENQSKVERYMPLRIAGYEGASYRSQLNEEKKSPVITIVLYFGKDHWTQPKSLKEVLSIPGELERYVNDVKIHVFEIAWLTQEQIDMFTSDFKIVANFFVQKRKNKNYVPDDKTEIKHVDEVLKLLSVMAQDSRYETVLPYSKEVKNMCDVAERLTAIGLEKGRTEGGNLMIYALVQDGDITPQKGAEKLGISKEELKKCMALTGYIWPEGK